MSRLFTFGCSFTKYSWPTWVDTIADQFDEVQNWGMPGSGNQSISIRLTQCHKANKITKDDTVLIMWTNITREDVWGTNGWSNRGNVYYKPFHPETIDALQWYALRDFTTIANTVWFLDHLGCNYELYSILPITVQYDQYIEQPKVNISVYERAGAVADLFGDELDRIKPSVLDVLYNGTWPKDRRDMHPLPGEHLKYMDLVSSYTPSDSARKRAYEQDMLVNDKIESFGPNRLKGGMQVMLSNDELSIINNVTKKNHTLAMSGLQDYELVHYE